MSRTKVVQKGDIFKLEILNKINTERVYTQMGLNPWEFINILNKKFNADCNGEMGIFFIKEDDAIRAQEWIDSRLVMGNLKGSVYFD